MNMIDRNKLKGFKRKNRNLPREEQDEGLGIKGLARVNIIGVKPGFHKEEQLKKKEKSHPLYY